ncbi:glycosyltransferase [Micrococcus luteus]|uniref:glycosyltransferase family 2 protein n=1 Tax=Micrococcus TaxID=1269 RepID=UPI00132FF996|nr:MULTISPECIES: glycosyltransferase family A protein [Micrococcus]MBU8762739.1 glycosyltransferase [Micrococcus luteus]UBH24486.1 glycosyltransferase family 2 protein [Micrococcus porci]
MNPRVSFVIPTYNDEPAHLQEAIASATAQTSPPQEIIVVDDGSTRADLLEFLRATDEGVQVIHQKNAGPSAARNAGITRATGDCIITLDGDDWLDPQFTAEAVHILQDATVEIAFASTRHFGQGEVLRHVSADYVLKDFMEMNKVPSAAMFRRSRWAEVGGYLESMRWGMEDYEFWVRVLRDGGIARPVPTAYYHYRSRENSRLSTLGTHAARDTHQAIVEANPEHHAILLQAAFLRLEEMHDLHLEYRSYVHKWQDRFRPLIRARDFAKRAVRKMS